MDSTMLENNPVFDVTAPAPRSEVRAGLAFELLIGLATLTTPGRETRGSWVPALAACSSHVRAAVAAVGERAGELFLHLLGVALDTGAVTADDAIAAVAGVDPTELRRHLVGVYVPAWRAVAGDAALEAAAAGDPDSIEGLLAHERYYAGRARESLASVLAVSPEDGKTRVLAVLRAFAEDVLAPHAAALSTELEREREVRLPLVDNVDSVSLVAAVARGYAYEPEREAARVVIVPHVAARPWLLLCQHRDARIICYPLEAATSGEEGLRERAVALGRGLGDPVRVAIVRQLAAGETSLSEVARAAGVAKSTAHHHLAQLRAAGLVEVRGNARAYFYALRDEGLDEAAALLRELRAPRDVVPRAGR